MAKLTLHIPENLVSAAKDEAANRKVSVSKLVTDFFRSLDSEMNATDPENSPDLAPLTNELAGCIPAVKASEYEDYLEEKYS